MNLNIGSMKKGLILIVLLIATISSMYGQSSKMDLSKKVVALSGAKETTEELMSMTIDAASKELTNVPKELWKEFEEAIDYSTFLKMVADVYNKNYSEKELKVFIKLLESGDETTFYEKTQGVSKQLYKLGNTFSTNSLTIIAMRLNELGYLND